MANKHIDILMQARQQMLDTRRTWAEVLGKPFDRVQTPNARVGFIETQQVIEAIDRAIEGELRGKSN
jgi:hypothetical protein